MVEDFGGVVVAHEGEHAAMPGAAGEIGVAEHVAGAVDAGPFAVPEAEHAVVLAFLAQLRLLAAPQRGRGELLVDAGLEQDVGGAQLRLRAHELLIEPAQRRAPIAGDVAGGVEAGAPVTLLLHQAQAHQRLIAGDEDPGLCQIEFVVEADLFERHRRPAREPESSRPLP